MECLISQDFLKNPCSGAGAQESRKYLPVFHTGKLKKRISDARKARKHRKH